MTDAVSVTVVSLESLGFLVFLLGALLLPLSSESTLVFFDGFDLLVFERFLPGLPSVICKYEIL
jgi:hypothetical protein